MLLRQFRSGIDPGIPVCVAFFAHLVQQLRVARPPHWLLRRLKQHAQRIEGRSVPLNPQAAEAVRARIEAMRQQGSVTAKTVLFRSRKGDNQPISGVRAYKILREVPEESELSGQLGTHSMRKTFANVVHEKLDRDISKTKKALGHKNISSTDSYLSFLQEEIDEAILAV